MTWAQSLANDRGSFQRGVEGGCESDSGAPAVRLPDPGWAAMPLLRGARWRGARAGRGEPTCCLLEPSGHGRRLYSARPCLRHFDKAPHNLRRRRPVRGRSTSPARSIDPRSIETTDSRGAPQVEPGNPGDTRSASREDTLPSWTCKHPLGSRRYIEQLKLSLRSIICRLGCRNNVNSDHYRLVTVYADLS